MTEPALPDEIPDVIDLAIKIHAARSLPQIREMDGKRWILEIPSETGGRWTMACVAAKQDVEPERCSVVRDLLPGQFAWWWNGWFAGIVTPFGGFLAAGETANEGQLVRDLTRLLEGGGHEE